MAVNAADAWQESGSRADRPYRAAPRGDRTTSTDRPGRPRGADRAGRAADRPRQRDHNRAHSDDAPPKPPRPPVPRRPEQSRPLPLDRDRDGSPDRDAP